MSATEATRDVNGTSPDLKRVIGPRLLLLFIVGDILGTGVYALTGSVARVLSAESVWPTMPPSEITIAGFAPPSA